MRKRTKISLILTLTLIILIGALWGGATYLIGFALTPQRSADFAAKTWQRQYDNYPGMQAWHDSLVSNNALRDTFMISEDGTRLHAYYIKAAIPTPRTAVLVHGYMDNAIGMMMLGRMYEREWGCNVFLPDLEYHGLSEGTHIGMGWRNSHEVSRWVKTLPTHFGDSLSVVVHGISMGAATTMMLSAQDSIPYIAAYVEDCGYTDAWSQFAKELKEDFGLPAFPLLYISSWICDAKYGWNFTEASAVNQVAKCTKPMLFIHGDADKFVPTAMVHPLYEAHRGPKELWLAPNTEHALSYRNHPEEYTSRVKSFLQKHAGWQYQR